MEAEVELSDPLLDNSGTVVVKEELGYKISFIGMISVRAMLLAFPNAFVKSAPNVRKLFIQGIVSLQASQFTLPLLGSNHNEELYVS